jgi:hypothetical protein
MTFRVRELMVALDESSEVPAIYLNCMPVTTPPGQPKPPGGPKPKPPCVAASGPPKNFDTWDGDENRLALAALHRQLQEALEN